MESTILKKRLIALGCLGLLGLLGCTSVPIGNRLTLLPAFENDTAVIDSGLNGRQTLTVSLLAPKDGSFRSQAPVHRWTSQDIYQYDLALSGGGLANPLAATLIPSNGHTKAAFTHLKVNTPEPYQLTVVARGNQGGTAPDLILNSQNPATQRFSFAGDNDVEDTQNIQVSIQLDSVPFNGTADVGLQPVDGGYTDGDPESVILPDASGSPTPVPTASPVPTPVPTPMPSPTPAGEGFFNLRIRFDQ